VIIVIDARLLDGFATLAVNHIQRGTKPWYFAMACQEVVIFAYIPRDSILTVKSWESVVESLPPWLIEPGSTGNSAGSH
jgi:hypothetical protein